MIDKKDLTHISVSDYRNEIYWMRDKKLLHHKKLNYSSMETLEKVLAKAFQISFFLQE